MVSLASSSVDSCTHTNILISCILMYVIDSQAAMGWIRQTYSGMASTFCMADVQTVSFLSSPYFSLSLSFVFFSSCSNLFHEQTNVFLLLFRLKLNQHIHRQCQEKKIAVTTLHDSTFRSKLAIIFFNVNSSLSVSPLLKYSSWWYNFFK